MPLPAVSNTYILIACPIMVPKYHAHACIHVEERGQHIYDFNICIAGAYGTDLKAPRML
jgi:hypothetical protein